MKKYFVSIAIATMVISLFLLPVIAAGQDGKQVSYPEGYRQWAHVKSMVIEKGHPLYESFGGIHHIYANKKALDALTKENPFPDGAVLIFDLLEAKSEDNAIIEGPRKVIGVMQKDSKKFPETGGWGFEGFKGDSRARAVTDAKSACFNCHEAQKQRDYVFSVYRK